MKKALFILLLICVQHSFAQKQTNFWYFGQLAGLNFTSGTPAAITNGAIYTTEGSSTISDASGNLLFYTDGVSVWNKNNAVMPNGTGLYGDMSTTQSALIIPKPGSSSLFYIFTLDDEGGSNGLRYSIVDMTLNAGNGDVTTKNTFLKNNMTEKLTAVFHCNGTDIWVAVHEFNTNTFYAYLVTSSGVNMPVISSVGPVEVDVHGQMKFNTNGTKVVCTRDTVIDATPATYQGKAFLDVFNFNSTTGVVSNPQILSLNNHQKTYGVEFSPDNSKLYVSYYDVTGINGDNSYLDQFDLSAANIQGSQTALGTSTAPSILRSLQLGPDGKIYVAKSNGPFVCVINSPNLAGASSNYVDNAINVDPGGMGAMCMLGLPGFIQSYFNVNFPNVPCAASVTANFKSSDTTICKNTCINFTDLSLGSPTSWHWTFTGATPTSSNIQNPQTVCYATAGTYTVKLVVSNGTAKDSMTEQIIVNASTINAGPDIIISPGQSTQLNATGNTSYTWTPATNLSSSTIANPVANPTVTTTYVVNGTTNNCGNTDSVTVFVEINCNGNVFVPTAFSPNGDGQNETECIMGNCIETLNFFIYDRWGEKVFETTDQKFCWDGVFRGKQMDSGIFVYYLKATFTNGKEITKKGNISLVR
jgi:gliding motility-associated-like protein